MNYKKTRLVFRKKIDVIFGYYVSSVRNSFSKLLTLTVLVTINHSIFQKNQSRFKLNTTDSSSVLN